jgi:PadR family transcriptional regulator PadR
MPAHPWRLDLRAVLLLLVFEQEQHGYDLRGPIAELAGADYNPAAVYRALRKLEQDGLVSSSWVPGEGGPPRRAYRITPAGRDSLEATVADMRRAARLARSFLRRYSRVGAGL